MTSINLEEALKEYLDFRADLGIKPSTTKNLQTCVCWMMREFPGETLLTQEMLDAWCQHRPQEEWNTFAGRVMPLRAFIRHWEARGYGPYTLPEIEKQKKYPHHDLMTAEKIQEYFQAADNLSDHYLEEAKRCHGKKRSVQLRIKAIIIPVSSRLPFSCGLRPNETRLLLRDSVNLEKGYIHLTVPEVKGYRERLVAIHPTMIPMMTACDRYLDEIIPGRRFFFSSMDNTAFSSTWFRDIFRRCWPEEPGQHHVTYDLRHNYAIMNLARIKDSKTEQKDLYAISSSMGHTSLKATQYYIHMTPRYFNIYEDD